MPVYNPQELDPRLRHNLLLGSISPRPIALIGTVDDFGNNNLSPYSFFNVFSSNPPVAIFSPARRVRNNTTKDTLHNAMSNKECTINVVTYDLVHQVNLSSAEYGSEVDEFVKAGFTALPSDTIAPMRVAESPVNMECIVKDVVHLGDEGGAGNLVVCEIKRIHVKDEVLMDNGFIDQQAIDLVGRLGLNWWVRASGDALFTVDAPKLGIGVDQIPHVIKNSTILSGNDLGLLGNIQNLPTLQEIEEKAGEFELKRLINNNPEGTELREALHEMASELLSEGKVMEAWKVLLIDKAAQ